MNNAESLCFEKTENGFYLKVKVIAKASRNEVLGIVSGRVKVAVRAVPQNGEANDALENTLATFFSIKKSCCSVILGHKSSLKTVFIASDIGDKIKTAFFEKINKGYD